MSSVFRQTGIRGNYTMFGKAVADPRRGSWYKLGLGWSGCSSVPGFQSVKFKTSAEGNWFKTKRENSEVQLVWDSSPGNRNNMYVQGSGWALMNAKTMSMMSCSLIRPDRLISSMRYPSGYKTSSDATCIGGTVNADAWSGMTTGFKGVAGPTPDSSEFSYRFGFKPYAHPTELKVGQALWAGEMLQTPRVRLGIDQREIYVLDWKTIKRVWTFDVTNLRIGSEDKQTRVGI
jgi:hypothetical protein